MKLRGIFIAAFFVFVQDSFSQSNLLLTEQLRIMQAEDQKWRTLMRLVNNGEVDTISKAEVGKKIREVDSLHLFDLRKIFLLYGYPGNDLVGSEGSHNFWLLVQHADRHPAFQDSVLKKMKIEVDKGNALAIDYAYLLDRVRTNAKQPQVYGTQMRINSEGTSWEPQPVEEPEKLDERRKSLNLEPMEEYIKLMNERYKGSLKPKVTINPPAEYGK